MLAVHCFLVFVVSDSCGFFPILPNDDDDDGNTGGGTVFFCATLPIAISENRIFQLNDGCY